MTPVIYHYNIAVYKQYLIRLHPDVMSSCNS